STKNIASRSVDVDTSTEVKYSTSESDANHNDISCSTASVNPCTTQILDRSIPECTIIPKKRNVLFQFNDQVFDALTDTGASVSLIDETLVKELGLSIDTTNNSGVIKFAHS